MEPVSILGLAPNEITQLVVLSVALLVGLFLARIIFKLTAALFRIGCYGIILIVAAVMVMNMLN